MRKKSPAIRLLVHLAFSLPLCFWGWQLWLTLQGQSTEISTDPAAVLADKTGFWAINCLLASLALTPLQRQFKLRWVIYRRAIGLWAFFYVLLHIVVFFTLTLDGDVADFFHEVTQRPYIVLGSVAALLLLPLAATSTEAAMRWLRKRWKTLHKLVYPAAILAVVHEIWQVKSFEMVAVFHAVVLTGLLGIRLYWFYRKKARRA